MNDLIIDCFAGGGGVMVLFCPDLTCKEEVKAMVIGT